MPLGSSILDCKSPIVLLLSFFLFHFLLLPQVNGTALFYLNHYHSGFLNQVFSLKFDSVCLGRHMMNQIG